jgi:hypothetical protein
VNKLPEVVMKYLKNENPEENVAEFGKDVKVYSIDEVSVSGVEVLIEWGSPVGNFDGLTKKDISFKWEEAKTNETRVFEVYVYCNLIFCLKIGNIFFFLAESARSWLA